MKTIKTMGKNIFATNNLYGIAKFMLFSTSYTPLFVLIISKQIYGNWSSIKCSIFSVDFISKFGLSILLTLIVFFSIYGCKCLLFNLKNDVKNGNVVTIRKISNRNGESIGYIATYIVPFMFQRFDSLYDFFAFSFIMIIIYRIYVNSNLLLINPLLSFKYSLFEIEYEKQNKEMSSGLVMMQNNIVLLEEGNHIKIYPIGFKLFYATKKE